MSKEQFSEEARALARHLLDLHGERSREIAENRGSSLTLSDGTLIGVKNPKKRALYAQAASLLRRTILLG